MYTPSTTASHTATRHARSRAGAAWLLAWCVLGCCLIGNSDRPVVRAIRAPAPRPIKAALVSPTKEPYLESSRQTKSIEKVRVGDSVLAFDLEAGQLVPKRVVETYHRVSRHLRILQVRSPGVDAQELRTTDEHPFWVPDKGWITAGRLSVGERLLQSDGTIATLALTRREEHPEGIPVFNFQVEGLHNYFVAQHSDSSAFVLVHNDCWTEAVGRWKANNFTGRIFGFSTNPGINSTGYKAIGADSHHYVYESPAGKIYDSVYTTGIERAQWLAQYMKDVNAQTQAELLQLLKFHYPVAPYGPSPPPGMPR